MTQALATRGYVCGAGSASLELTALFPDAWTERENNSFQMGVVVNLPVGSPTAVVLASSDPAVVDVPSSVEIQTDDLIAYFTATSLSAGTAQVSAQLGSDTLYADITVVEIGPAESPTPRGTTNLAPTPGAGANLRPKITGTEEL